MNKKQKKGGKNMSEWAWIPTMMDCTAEELINRARKLGAVAVGPIMVPYGHDYEMKYIGVKFFGPDEKVVLEFIGRNEDESYEMFKSVEGTFPDYVSKFYP